MSDENGDLDNMSQAQLRELKQKVLLCIEFEGTLTGDSDQKIAGAKLINKLYAYVKEIETRLSSDEKDAS